MRVVLASKSPRRTEILTTAKIKHTVRHCKTDLPEIIDTSLEIEDAIIQIAKEKALCVFEEESDAVVIGVDTVVLLDSVILGKPKSKIEAVAMIEQLQGRKHSVLTGVFIISKEKTTSFYAKTEVEFSKMTTDEIIHFVENEEVYDKAGAYAIQGLASRYIKSITGDYYNVMGLPVCQLYKILKQYEKNPQ
ncbi:MAG TPA: Maf family protein [Bacilli bacterium]|nr:Maf family protein [Bacilli bacterium]